MGSNQPGRRGHPRLGFPIGKAIEAGADIAENLGNAIGGFFQVGPAYDPEEEAFIREMKRRPKRKRGRSL